MLIYGVRLLKHRAAWIKMQSVPIRENEVTVSIVVVARNELQNLQKLIPKLKAQTYMHISEIIVVDDESTDGTIDYLRSEGVRVLESHPQSNFRKKEGLKLALKHATGDIILQTDADCWVGERWVENMVNAFEEQVHLVQGPLTYWGSGSFVSGVLTAEQSVLNGLSGSGIALGQPALSNAANMAYYKDAFDPEITLGSNLTASGDDSEIHGAIAGKHGTLAIKFNKDIHAIVYAKPPISLSEFFHQRLRWASKVSLRTLTKGGIDTFIFSLANFMVIAMIPAGILGWIAWEDVWLFFLVKYLIDLTWFLTVWPFYQVPDCGKGWLVDSIALVIFYPLYTAIFGLLSKFVPYKWKGQKIAPSTRSNGRS